MSCDVGHRHGSDPMFLWLWCRPAAEAPIGPLAWEPAYAMVAALQRTKDKKKEKKSQKPILYKKRYYESYINMEIIRKAI